ncbi:hypothetical protein ILUMI_02466 [Ignelater luminosus]|uniref:Uncharacterized protein n=1 Tax=Ignelater luminosus TaxID=2038154 RepID=A0A8K0DGF4_IGNLU|nr:hypothetical protein ILUMI_02466 [Ignelater luminosus]
MFSKKSKSKVKQQRQTFPLTSAQIVEDIDTVINSEENRNKLFTCLDDKVPPENSCAGIEEFLKGTQKLEEIQVMLKKQIEKLQVLSEDLLAGIDEIEGKIEACQ